MREQSPGTKVVRASKTTTPTPASIKPTRPGAVAKKTSTEGTERKTPPRGDRAKRLLDLVMLLMRARIPVTFREIRERFDSYHTANIEAGLRAFERDKADLLELGVPIRYVTPEEDDAIEDGGYVVDLKHYLLPEVKLTSDEISSLVLAASVARVVPAVGYAQVVDLAMRKLAFDMPFPDTPSSEWLPRPSELTEREPVVVHYPEVSSDYQRELGERFAQLEAATRNRKTTTFVYQTASKGQVRKRMLDPYALVYRDGNWLVVGRCHLRKDLRSFRLDRMSDLSTAPKPKSPDFARPDDFDARSYASRSPWTFASAEPETVELDVHPGAASIANDDFGADAIITTEANDHVRIRFNCTNPSYAVARILAAKGGIAVRLGPRLQAQLADELAAIARLYAGDSTDTTQSGDEA